MRNQRTIPATASYAVIHSATWGFYAVLLVYSSNFLYNYGFADGQISLFLGLATLASCVLQLVCAELIARLKRLQTFHVLLAMALLMVAGSAMMLSGSLLPAVAGLWLDSVLLQAIPAMTNAIGMDAIAHGSPIRYGVSRGIGSGGYSLLALLTGQLVQRLGTGAVAAVALGTSVAFVAGALWFRRAGDVPVNETAVKQESSGRGGFVKSYPLFSCFLLGAILLYTSHNLITSFMMQVIVSKGGNAANQGVATFLAALTEIPVMFAFAWLLRKASCRFWLYLSALFFLVKAMGLYLAGSMAAVYAVQATQFLGYALFSIAAVYYAESTVGGEDTVRAQSYLSSTTAIGGLIASFSGGYLCQLLGAPGMLLVSSAFAIAGITVVVLSIRAQRKELISP